MKKIILLLLCVAFFSLATNAQTKRVAHRSHSGSFSNYATVEDNDNLGNIEPNFYYESKIQIDSFYKTQDSIKEYYRIKDSIYRAQILDSLKNKKKVKPTTLKDSVKIKQKAPSYKKEPKKGAKQQSFPIPLLLLVAIPAVGIAFLNKNLK